MAQTGALQERGNPRGSSGLFILFKDNAYSEKAAPLAPKQHMADVPLEFDDMEEIPFPGFQIGKVKRTTEPSDAEPRAVSSSVGFVLKSNIVSNSLHRREMLMICNSFTGCAICFELMLQNTQILPRRSIPLPGGARSFLVVNQTTCNL